MYVFGIFIAFRCTLLGADETHGIFLAFFCVFWVYGEASNVLNWDEIKL